MIAKNDNPITKKSETKKSSGKKNEINKPDNNTLSTNNLTAQIHHRGAGNPASVLPRSAISNCFPGLEFDFRNLWRRAFEGIVLVENNNYVIEADAKYKHLVSRRLLRFEGLSVGTMVETTGPVFPDGGSVTLATAGTPNTAANPNAVSFMEWSNSIARILHLQGKTVECEFSDVDANTELLADKVKDKKTLKVKLKLRTFFDENTASFNPELLQPGELTQGLCAPWQNDYRECACYYWAASRPDYVNVEPGVDGVSQGDMWFSKKRTGTYIPDNRTDTRLYSYDDLFKSWQENLQFIIRGKDADES